MTPLRTSIPLAWAAFFQSKAALEAAVLGTDLKSFARPGCNTCHGTGVSTAEVPIRQKGIVGSGNKMSGACHCAKRRRARAVAAFW